MSIGQIGALTTFFLHNQLSNIWIWAPWPNHLFCLTYSIFSNSSSVPVCFIPSLSLTCCDLLATVTFFPLISVLQSTPNTAAKVIFLVHDSDHVKSSLSPSGGFLSHFIQGQISPSQFWGFARVYLSLQVD